MLLAAELSDLREGLAVLVEGFVERCRMHVPMYDVQARCSEDGRLA